MQIQINYKELVRLQTDIGLLDQTRQMMNDKGYIDLDLFQGFLKLANILPYQTKDIFIKDPTTKNKVDHLYLYAFIESLDNLYKVCQHVKYYNITEWLAITSALDAVVFNMRNHVLHSGFMGKARDFKKQRSGTNH